MKEFTIALLGVIFVALIAGSIQSIYADHILEDGKGIFKDQDHQSFTKTIDSNSKYQIHLHVIVRNAQDQLVSVSEATHGKYIPHEITDFVFDNIPGLSREIVEKLNKFRPPTLFAASEISGVTPAAIDILHLYIKMRKGQK